MSALDNHSATNIAEASGRITSKQYAKLAKIIALVRSRRKAHAERINASGVASRLPLTPTKEDWLRLADGEFLNDALLDYYLGHLIPRLGGGRVHAFSSLFFGRLANGGYAAVGGWTRSLRRESPAGIFARDFLLIPVHDAEIQHWWLAVVYHPAAAGSVSTPGHLATGTSECAAGSSERSRRTGVAFLDSLVLSDPDAGGAREMRALQLLRGYLASEWSACFGVGCYREELVLGTRIQVPQQSNGADCGIFVLEFALRLLRDHTLLENLGYMPVSLPTVHDPRRRWRALAAELHDSTRKAHAKMVGNKAGKCVTPLRLKGGPDLTRTSPACASPPEERHRRGEEGLDGRGSKSRRLISPQSNGTSGVAVASSSASATMVAGGAVVLWVSQAVATSLSKTRMVSLRALGGSVASVSSSDEAAADVVTVATHLVITGGLRRTLKVMCAICRGLYIVTKQWLDASLKQGRWLDEARYAPTLDTITSARPQPPIATVLLRARASPLLAGRVIYIDSSLPAHAVIAIRCIVRAARGLVASSASEASVLIVRDDELHERVGVGSEGNLRLTQQALFEAAMTQMFPSSHQL